MSLLAQNINDYEEPLAKKVWLTEDMINLELLDGRQIAVPLVFYPSLADATKEEREEHRLYGEGSAIRFEKIDIDLSVESLVMGRKEIPNLMEKVKKFKKEKKLPLE